jgi:hypothetical protein
MSARVPNWFWLSQQVFKPSKGRDVYAFVFLVLSSSLALGLFGVVTSYQRSIDSWMQRLNHWDLLVSQKDQKSGQRIPFSEAVQEKLESLPGVLAVSSDYQVRIHQGDLRANMFILDAYAQPLKSLKGVATEALSEALKKGRTIAIAQSLATLYNLDTESQLSLMTPTGVQLYDIIAIIDDTGAEPRGIFIDRAQYSLDWQLEAADLFAISLDHKANPAKVMQLIKQELSESYLVDVVPVSTFQEGV